MASGEAAPAAMPMQTVVLKVSIHCHGCKKKVRKVLKSIEGVHDVKVEAGQHKVAVTGTVDADTLVKRLYKSGKQALLLQPHAAPPQPMPAAPAAATGDGGKDAASAATVAEKKPAEPVKEPQAEKVSKKKPEQEAAAAAAEKKPEAESKTEESKPSVEAKSSEAKPSVEEAAPKAKAHEPAEETVAAPAKEAADNEEGEAKKSKQPEDAGEAKKPVVTAERTLSAPPPAMPKHMMYEEYDHHYYAPQPVLSYHMAQPRSTSVSYYAPQPQTAYSMQEPQPAGYPTQHQAPPQPAGYPTQHQAPPPPRRAYSMEEPMPQQYQQQQWSPSYLYMPYPHSNPEPYYQDYYSPPGSHAPPLQDSYRMFDDENPNACSVM